jgi:hypothetical protein
MNNGMASGLTRNPRSASQSAYWVVAAFAVLCSLAFLFANLRHTQSLSFPVDDGFIYSNYVLGASTGHPFEYNPGETSGGITGLGWLLVCTLAYWLLAPFHALLGGLAPPEVQLASLALAQQTGHLLLAAYIPAIICFAFTVVGVYRLAILTLPPSTRNPRFRDFLAIVTALAVAGDITLVWGALSGLEVPLSTVLSVWAVVFLLLDYKRGVLRWSLLLVALLPWARPDLLAISGAALLWLLLRALFAPGQQGRTHALRNVALYALAIGLGVAAMCSIYFVGWGRPLPASFYAKVRSLRIGDTMFTAMRQLLLGGRDFPVIAGAIALIGGIVGILLPPRSSDKQERTDTFWNTLLVLMVAVVYLLAIMLTLSWFGQEERYTMPLHPFGIVLLGVLVWRLLDLLPIDRLFAIPIVRQLALALVALVLLATDYVWATRQYVVEVRNIRDAHITPSLWMRTNIPDGDLIASEPIGAIRLFSNHRTLDIVGLTSPVALGTYRDWPRAWDMLHSQAPAYFFYYPSLFPDGSPPAWTTEVQQFPVPDNRIAGADPIAVYKFDWTKYTPAP